MKNRGTFITLAICFFCIFIGNGMVSGGNEELGAGIMLLGIAAFFGYGMTAMIRNAKNTKIICPYCKKELPPQTLKQMGRSINAIGRGRAACPYCGASFDPSFARKAK